MNPSQVINCKQNTPEWDDARRGFITASGVSALLTKPKSGKGTSKTAQAYIDKLARARIFGVSDREKSIWNFVRGHALEPIARELYEHHFQVHAEETGFWLRDLTGQGHFLGASPDFLIGEHGIGEIKTRWEVAQWDAVMTGQPPEDAQVQIQAQLLATDRQYCDYVSYCDGMHLMRVKVESNIDLQSAIRTAVVDGELAIRRAVEAYRLASAGMLLTERIPDADTDFTSLS